MLLSRAREGDQPLYSWLWGSGFLPSQHQGVQFRGGKDPVLYLSDPDGVSRTTRRRMLDTLARARRRTSTRKVMDPGDRRARSRSTRWRTACRQPCREAMDLKDEPDAIFDLYGPEARKPGTFAANCLLARRLAERNVRFIQLYHQGWDQHGNLPPDIQIMTKSVDQAVGGAGRST